MDNLSGGFCTLGLGCVLLFCAIGTSLAATALHVVVVNTESLVNLGLESGFVIDPVKLVSPVCSVRGFSVTYNARSSELSISRSIPVILPASSGCICWIFG